MNETQERFVREVERVRDSGLVGRSGRLRELFDFLADRGLGAEPASQAEIAETVFGHGGSDADDATARVYIHRLRKRLEQFYEREGTLGGRLVLPAGTYALLFEEDGTEAESLPPARRRRLALWPVLLGLAFAVVVAFLVGRVAARGGGEHEANAIWAPFVESERPIMLAIGDYYIFGEIDPMRPEDGRLIRDFSINSPTDLARAQEADPERYGATGDMGLNYLPFSSAYALHALMPVLAQHPRPVGVMPASQLSRATFREYNVIYVGLLSGMALMEDVNFTNSAFAIGENYDELIEVETGRRYISGEALSLPTRGYYRDYGYISRFREPGGALVAVVAGERDTGLRGLAPLVAGELPERLQQLGLAGDGFEALYEITGQQGADLGAKLVTAQGRP